MNKIFEFSKNRIKTFIISKNLVLKLENDITNIYVNGEKFLHCKYILLNFEKRDISEYDKFENMDQVIKHYSRKHESDKTLLSPDTEFIGHCSNLQYWYENQYDLNILHSSLSIPLLRELANSGDEMARMAIKEEILLRVKSNNQNNNTIIVFLEEEYFDYFEIEELEILFENIDIEDQLLLRRINKYINKKRIIDNLKKTKKRNIKVNYDKFDGKRNKRKIL